MGFCPDQRAFQARGSFFPKNTRELPGILYMGDNLLCSARLQSNKDNNVAWRATGCRSFGLQASHSLTPISAQRDASQATLVIQEKKDQGGEGLSPLFFLSWNYEGIDALEVWLLRASCHKPMDTKQNSLLKARPPPLFREPRMNRSLPDRDIKCLTSKEWVERAIKRDTNWTFLFF